MKKLFTSICTLLLSTCGTFAQQTTRDIPQLSIHVSSPLGLINKLRMKVEYRVNENMGLLVGGAQYWGSYPGWQAFTEFRGYMPIPARWDLFLYGKAGLGNLINDNPLFPREIGTSVSYKIAGGGVGFRYSSKSAFFMEANLGAKYPVVDGGDSDAVGSSIISGPCSLIDVNFNFGFHFTKYKPKS